MTDQEKFEISGDLDIEQTRMAAMTLWTCLRHAVVDMYKTNGAQHALDFQRKLILAVKNGDITMPLNKETETFKFVIALLEALITVEDDGKNRDDEHKP